jgi:hypothetical protein
MKKKSVLPFSEANISKKHSFIAEAMFYKDETKLTPKQSRFNSISETN